MADVGHGSTAARQITCAVVATCCWMLSIGIGIGAAQGARLTGYSIATWNEENGLPSGVVWALAQSSDGDLWIGTDAGLVRFDGLRFSPWDASHENRLPTASVRALLAAADGSVWAGFGDPGGIGRVHGRQLQYFGQDEGLPAAALAMLFEHPQDGIWAGTLAGLFELSGARWHPVGHGLPEGVAVFSANVIDGTTMVGTAEGIYQRQAGSDNFEKIDDRLARAIAADPSGNVWVSDPVVSFRRLSEDPAPASSTEQGRGNRLLFDRRGNLWSGNRAQGLWRTTVINGRRSGPVERATTLAGLSNDGVEALLEVSDGNIWVGTSAGLNRLTPHKVTQVTDLGLVRGIEFSPDGEAWIGTVDAVIEMSAAHNRRPRRRVRLSNSTVLAMHVDKRGQLWVATSDALLQVDATHIRRTLLPAPYQPSAIHAISSDARGALWIAAGGQGLLRLEGSRVSNTVLPPELRSVEVVSVRVDRRQHVWVAFGDGRVAEVGPGNAVNVYGAIDHRSRNQYRVMFEGGDGVLWLGGTERFGRIRNGQFEVLGKDLGLPPGAIDAIVEDGRGAIWISIFSVGIVRFARSDLDAAFSSRGDPLRLKMYDRSDGVAGTPQGWTVSCGLLSPDGRLWFVTGRGLTVIDPRLVENGTRTVSSDVRLDSALADGKSIPITSSAALAPRLARLEIDYTVLNLISPLKSRFKYRLEGFDKEWVDAGRRRQAVYTNLPPGDYQFRVITSDDGTWSKPGLGWRFSIAPAFYQTSWFFAACAAGVALAVGGAWRLHLMGVRRSFELVLNERARLSREIHDTLLQSMVGLSLQVDAIGGDLDAAPTMSKERLVRLRKNLNEYIREARQSIRNLRSPMLEQLDLAKALRQAGENMTSGRPVSFSLNVIGTLRRCPAAIEEQLLRIGQEAITNALRHAAAEDIRVELTYDEATVAVRVVDNGSGFDLASVFQDSGHLGMTSMKERAEAIGGLFSLRTVIGKGTEVHAVIPSPQ